MSQLCEPHRRELYTALWWGCAEARRGKLERTKGDVVAEGCGEGVLLRAACCGCRSLLRSSLPGSVLAAGDTAGIMTTRVIGLALLIGPDQKWLSTTGFLDKVDENLQKAMTA